MKAEIPTTDERAERCETCRWWVEDEDSNGIGDCRRYPPTVLWLSNTQERDLAWPNPFADNFCGEWAMSLGEVTYNDIPKDECPEALAALRQSNWPKGWEPFAKANDEFVDVGVVHEASGTMYCTRYHRGIDMERIIADANDTIRKGLKVNS